MWCICVFVIYLFSTAGKTKHYYIGLWASIYVCKTQMSKSISMLLVFCADLWLQSDCRRHDNTERTGSRVEDLHAWRVSQCNSCCSSSRLQGLHSDDCCSVSQNQVSSVLPLCMRPPGERRQETQQDSGQLHAVYPQHHTLQFISDLFT